MKFSGHSCEGDLGCSCLVPILPLLSRMLGRQCHRGVMTVLSMQSEAKVRENRRNWKARPKRGTKKTQGDVIVHNGAA